MATTYPVIAAIGIAARNQALIDRADIGPNNSTIEIFSGENQSGVLLATIVLDKPCGVLQANRIRLLQLDLAGNFAEFDGIPASARWRTAAGQELMLFTASKMDGDGHIKVNSRTGGDIYAGGRVVLAPTALIG